MWEKLDSTLRHSKKIKEQFSEVEQKDFCFPFYQGYISNWSEYPVP